MAIRYIDKDKYSQAFDEKIHYLAIVLLSLIVPLTDLMIMLEGLERLLSMASHSPPTV